MDKKELYKSARDKVKKHEYNEAIAILRGITKHDYEDNFARLMIVDILEKQSREEDIDNYKSIKNVIRTAENVNPNDIRIKLKMADIYLRRNNIEVAQRRILDAMDINPKNYDARFYKAKIYRIKGNDSGAEKIYLDLIEENPKDNYVRLELSDIYLQHRKYIEALEQIDAALIENPLDKPIILKKIVLYIVRGDLVTAFGLYASYEQILKKDASKYVIERINEIESYLNYMLYNKKSYRPKYFESQLVDYSKDRCISNVIMNHYSHNLMTVKPVFLTNNRTELEKLYDKVEESIKYSLPNSRGLIDKYVINLHTDFGKINQVLTQKMLVKTICNTNNILDFSPIDKSYATSKFTNNKVYTK